MQNVISLMGFKLAKNPVLAIAHKLENHEENILRSHYHLRDFKSFVLENFKGIRTIIFALIVSNIISWLMIAAIVLAFINHDHNIYGLI